MIRKACLAMLLVAFAMPAQAQHRHTRLDVTGNLDALIARHAAANHVPASLVRRIIHRESRGNPRAVHNGNYGLMQIRLGTARAMGYRGSARGLLDADTNMTYAVKYLAGAYRAAGGNADRAVHYYAAGYHYPAKHKGPTDAHAAHAIGAFLPAVTRGHAAKPAHARARISLQRKIREARAEGLTTASSSNHYTGALEAF